MTSVQLNRAVGIFPDRPTTASALQLLRDAGFSTSQITVIARDAEREAAIAGVKVHDRIGNHQQAGAAAGAYTGGVLGSVAGLLVGVGTLTSPVLAPFLVLGGAAALGTTVAGAIAGTVAGGLVGGLIGMGVPADRARRCGDRVAQGEYLVVLQGIEREIQRAESTLQGHGGGEWNIYPVSGKAVTSSGATATVAIANPAAASPTVTNPTPANLESPRTRSGSTPQSTSSLAAMATPRSVANPAVAETSTYTKRAIGMFRNQQLMEAALEALSITEFPMHKVSLIMQDAEQVHHQVQGSNAPLSQHTNPAVIGMTGLLAGLVRVPFAGLGSLLLVGSEATTLAADLPSGAIDSGSLVRALANLGISQAQARVYAEQVGHGGSLVTVRSTGGEALQAAVILNQYGMQNWGVYDVAESNPALSRS